MTQEGMGTLQGVNKYYIQGMVSNKREQPEESSGLMDILHEYWRKNMISNSFIEKLIETYKR